jgi:hypothetical protein
MEIKVVFEDFAKTFEKKIDKDYKIRLQFEFYDMENGVWQIDVNNGKVFVYNGIKINPESTFLLSKETLFKMYNNEISASTAFSNEPDEKGEMRALIEPKHKDEVKKLIGLNQHLTILKNTLHAYINSMNFSQKIILQR